MRYLVIFFLLLSCCSEAVDTDKCKAERQTMEQVTATYNAHLNVRPPITASQIIRDTWQGRYLSLTKQKAEAEINYKQCLK